VRIDQVLAQDQRSGQLDFLPRTAHWKISRRPLHGHHFLAAFAVHEHREHERPRVGLASRDVRAGDPPRLARAVITGGGMAWLRSQRHGEDDGSENTSNAGGQVRSHGI
jgi:hypothetical protein